MVSKPQLYKAMRTMSQLASLSTNGQVDPQDILDLGAFFGNVSLMIEGRPTPDGDPEYLASRFHEAYERLAPDFGYETRQESAKPWVDVPENNRRLMTAVCAELLGRGFFS